MSGHKRTTITISETEYRRLCEADAHSRLLQDQLPAMLEKARQEVRNTLWVETQESQQRQRGFHELVKTFDEDFQQSEAAQNQLFLETQETFQKQLQSLEMVTQENMNSLQGAFMNQIEDLLQLQQASAQRLQEQQQCLADQQQRIAQLEQSSDWLLMNEEHKAQTALRWLQYAEVVFHFIQNHYDSERFLPGEMQRIATRLRQAYLNLEDGFADAALLEAQQIYQQCSAIRLSLELLQNEWLTLRTALLNGYQTLLTLAEEQQFVQAMDLEGNLLEQRVEVDAWTRGALTRFARQVEQSLIEIQKDQPPLGLETLQKLVKEDLLARENQLAEIVLRARLELLNAQLRVNIADLTVQALQQQGFTAVQTRFQSNDMRRGYQVLLKNLEGAEVVVKIDPDPQEYGKNELHLYSSDQPSRTEHELWQRAQVIQDALHQYGLMPAAMTEVKEQRSTRVSPLAPSETTNVRQSAQILQPARQFDER